MVCNLQVSTTFKHATGTAYQQNRQRIKIVLIGITHAAAIQDHGMVEQAAIAIRCGRQLVKETLEHTDMIIIKDGKLVLVFLFIGMMRGSAGDHSAGSADGETGAQEDEFEGRIAGEEIAGPDDEVRQA